MSGYRKIISENIIHPSSLVPVEDNQIWSIYTTSQVKKDNNVGYIMAKDTVKDSDPIFVTKELGNYGAVKAVSDADTVWIVYTKYYDRQKCIYLSIIKDGMVHEPVMIEDFGKHDNPEVCIHDGSIWIGWESYESGQSQIMYKTLTISSLHQNGGEFLELEAKALSSPKEKAYKPAMISDGKCLYVAYESFFQKRYHLMVRCCSNTQGDFSDPYEIGFPDKNDQSATMCLHEGKVLVAWENSSPLEKGDIWIDHEGKEISMPGFGHGWKVYTRIGLRRIAYINGVMTIEDLKCSGNEAPFININTQESSGCPRVFTNSKGRIFIAYLAWIGGWGIKVKYLKGTKWVEIRETGLIKKQRTSPSVYMDNSNNRVYLLGHKVDLEEKSWTYENNSTWIEMIDVMDEADCEAYSFSSQTISSTEVTTDHKNERKVIECEDKKFNLFWGDIHMHSNLSGCSLHPKFHCTELDEKYRFSRDVGQLDFAMITDHDSMSEYEWHMTRDIAHFNNLPGKFTAFAGFEWTCTQKKDKPNYGHYNVLYRDTGSLYKTSDEVYGNVENLWGVLEKGEALTIPHHPGCKTHPLNWNYYNSDFVPLVEIFQVRGSYEYDECSLHPENYGRQVIRNNSVQNGLNKGYKLGFTSGGEHEGVGVTAVYSESLTRDALFEALQKRQVYGTTGDRIFVDFRINGRLMGSELVTKNTQPKIEIKVVGTSNINEIKVIRNGKCIKEWNPNCDKVNLEWIDDSLPQEEKDYYYYITVMQDNNEMAWASPVFLTIE